MPHKGPGMRTSRTRALEIGTDPRGFDDGANYCPQCGHPTNTGLPHSHYEEQAPAVTEGGAQPINSTPPAVK